MTQQLVVVSFLFRFGAVFQAGRSLVYYAQAFAALEGLLVIFVILGADLEDRSHLLVAPPSESAADVGNPVVQFVIREGAVGEAEARVQPCSLEFRSFQFFFSQLPLILHFFFNLRAILIL